MIRPTPHLSRAVLGLLITLGASPVAAQQPDSSLQAASTPAATATADTSRPAAAHPDLSGVWRLNKELSDDVGARIQEAMETLRQQMGPGGPGGERGGRRGGVGPGIGGGRGRGHGGGGAAGSDNPTFEDEFGGRRGGRGGPEGLAGLAQGVEMLLITQEQDTIELVDGQDRTSRYFTDGRTLTREVGGRRHSTTASWVAGRLRLNSVVDDGPAIIRTYGLDPQTGRLLVDGEIRLPRTDETFSFQLVYEGI
jgi:hypothetical protein